jgi:flagellar motility protein MotE (MotC chaperone)
VNALGEQLTGIILSEMHSTVAATLVHAIDNQHIQ